MERFSQPPLRRFSTLSIAEGFLCKARRLWEGLKTASSISRSSSPSSSSSCFILVTLSNFCEV